MRKLPPVPKFSAEDRSMGPPPSKSSSSSSRGAMGPPHLPRFQSSQMGPPEVPPRPPSSLEEPPSKSVEQSGSEEESTKSAELQINGSGELAASEGNGVSEVERTSRLSVAEDGSKRQRLHPAGATSGSNPGQPPYVKPSWGAIPGQPFTLEILKEGNILGVEDVSKKAVYMFGRSDRCDFVLEHPTVSRYHAVLQYNSKGESFLYDLGSTHGTFVNKLQVKGREYVPLHVGDIVRFGFSSRLHVFQGPPELIPEEGLTKKERQAQRLVEAAQDRAIREASIIRAKRDSMSSDGVSWGMQEDAEEEAEENVEEVTWQTFKGELTEKQQKTLAKIHKYNEKLSNLRKENDAIQAKELPQGGLTQGQQTQVARNEQRMEQLVEEVENLEETLNDSIQESVSGRAGLKRRGKKNSFDVEEEEDLSDNDEFYDRASKGQPRKKKDSVQKVETADSLLDLKVALTTEIESLRNAIKAEEETSSLSQEAEVAKMEVETADPLDQFMTNLSSTIVKDKASHLQKELDSLSKELARVERLLKLADPTGEGLKKWELKKSVEGNQEADILKREMKRIFTRKEDAQDLATSVVDVSNKSDQMELQDGTVDAGELKADDNADESVPSTEDPIVLPGLEPPVRLGAPMPEAQEETKPEVSDKVNEEAGNFVTYKERKKVIGGNSGPQISVVQVVAKDGHNSTEKKEDVSAVDLNVADSVALLLRQKRGLVAEDSDVVQDTQQKNAIANVSDTHRLKQSKKRKKQGPAKLSLSNDVDSAEDWVPPAGQTGDGRTALNDKYGY
ncbi:unnamed protein product [Calypogeia fissa]